jgi:hypothetical protein
MKYKNLTLYSTGTVIPVLHKVSTTPRRHMEEWSYSSSIRNLCTSGHLYAAAAILSGKKAPAPCTKMGGLHSLSEWYEEEKSLLSLLGIKLRLSGSPACIVVAPPSDISQLLTLYIAVVLTLHALMLNNTRFCSYILRVKFL